MKRLPWLRFRDHQRGKLSWQASFVDVMPADSSHACGLCVYETREILILVTEPLRKIPSILAHELLHAACAGQRCKLPLEQAAEETIALLVESALLPIMASVFACEHHVVGGQLPPFPEGFAAFRRAARTSARSR